MEPGIELAGELLEKLDAEFGLDALAEQPREFAGQLVVEAAGDVGQRGVAVLGVGLRSSSTRKRLRFENDSRDRFWVLVISPSSAKWRPRRAARRAAPFGLC